MTVKQEYSKKYRCTINVALSQIKGALYQSGRFRNIIANEEAKTFMFKDGFGRVLEGGDLMHYNVQLKKSGNDVNIKIEVISPPYVVGDIGFQGDRLNRLIEIINMAVPTRITTKQTKSTKKNKGS
jgi:hypothetical protein